jgi:hypothetical protein
MTPQPARRAWRRARRRWSCANCPSASLDGVEGCRWRRRRRRLRRRARGPPARRRPFFARGRFPPLRAPGPARRRRPCSRGVMRSCGGCRGGCPRHCSRRRSPRGAHAGCGSPPAAHACGRSRSRRRCLSPQRSPLPAAAAAAAPAPKRSSMEAETPRLTPPCRRRSRGLTQAAAARAWVHLSAGFLLLVRVSGCELG